MIIKIPRHASVYAVDMLANASIHSEFNLMCQWAYLANRKPPSYGGYV